MYEDLFVVLTCNCALILTLVRLHLITPSISIDLKMLHDLPISNLPDLWWYLYSHRQHLKIFTMFSTFKAAINICGHCCSDHFMHLSSTDCTRM
jgi:hypothetical protein